MNQSWLEAFLADIPLDAIRYVDQIGSTNEAAIEWAAQGAPDLALVIADEQTTGRGRFGRRWFTPPGAALAFSLVLRPEISGREKNEIASQKALAMTGVFPSQPGVSPQPILRLTALGALAVSGGLRENYNLETQIKWPNDVLAGGRKLAGVLVEAQWQDEQLLAAILGIGINIAPASVPPAADVLFPATCLEAALGHPVERWDVLHATLESLLCWRERLASADFIQAWQERLAYKDEWVRITAVQEVPAEQEILTTQEVPAGANGSSESFTEGIVVGLENPDGFLRLRKPSGEIELVQAGDVHLRPMSPT